MVKKAIRIGVVLVIALLLVGAYQCGGGGGGGETVTVEVCAASGLLPNEPWCLTIETRTFKKGSEPTVICGVHKKPETVKLVVCVTSHLYPNPWCPEKVEEEFEVGHEPTATCSIHKKTELEAKLVIAAYDLLNGQGDKIAFVKRVAAAVGYSEDVYLRVFGCSNWNREWTQPWPVVARWNAGYDLPADALPMYDLTLGNEIYWETFRGVFRTARDVGLGIQLVLEDRTGFGAGADKYRNPFCSNIQDRDPLNPEVNRLPGGVWAIGAGTIEPYHRAWVNRAVAELNACGVHYLIEVTNEYDSLDNSPEQMIEWHARRVEDLLAAGVPKEWIVGSAIREGPAIAKQVGVYSLHGFVRPQDIFADYASFGPNAKLLLSGDGGFNGAGRPDKKSRKGASAEEASAIARLILERGYFGYELLDRGLYGQNNDIANYDGWDPEPARAIVSAFRR